MFSVASIHIYLQAIPSIYMQSHMRFLEKGMEENELLPMSGMAHKQGWAGGKKQSAIYKITERTHPPLPRAKCRTLTFSSSSIVSTNVCVCEIQISRTRRVWICMDRFVQSDSHLPPFALEKEECALLSAGG